MLRRVSIDVGVVLVLIAAYFTQDWVRQRWTEFTVMRAVVANVACSNPPEAAKLGIVCRSPESVLAPAPAQNGTPASPVAPKNP